jgi:D-alanyl-lipoteichoic acid acyltransferase DltB (MBOAT superfamily)
VYIPLGGSRGSVWNQIRNVFIIFIISGFWHGAKWTFIIWGLLNAIYFLPLLIAKKNRINLDSIAKGKFLPTFLDFFRIIITFSLTVFAWIFFRAENLTHAFNYISEIFSESLFTYPQLSNIRFVFPSLLIFVFMLIEWFGRNNKYAIENVSSIKNRFVRWLIYGSLLLVIIIFFKNNQEFIYFQF